MQYDKVQLGVIGYVYIDVYKLDRGFDNNNCPTKRKFS